MVLVGGVVLVGCVEGGFVVPRIRDICADDAARLGLAVTVL